VTVIADRYELHERIGGGGMADVFRAHDRTLDRDVALKLMRPAFANDAEFLERFRREADALASIEHPNIVRVFDFGSSADGPFMVMELVGGGTLRQLMRERGRLDQYDAARIGAGIADGLEAAHLRGVLHRDLKPDNVLLDAEGTPKIADFGIARIAAATAITRTGEVLGTPQYLAPEQMTGEVVDERADVYGLGVILYEMLTGTQPTGGTTPSEIISRRLRADPRPPAKLAAMRPEMNAIVLRALARDPERRFARAAALRDSLRTIVASPAPPPETLAPPLGASLAAAFAALVASARAGAGRSSADARATLARAPRFRRPVFPRLPAVSFAPLAAALNRIALALQRWIAWCGAQMTLVSDRAAVTIAGLRSRLRRPAFPALPRPRPIRGPIAPLAAPRRRDAAPILVTLALLAFVGGSLAFAQQLARVELPPAASVAPTAAVLASTSTPAPTPVPTPAATSEPTPEPTAEPTAEPTVAPAPPVIGARDPARTIVAFYQLISGHDYTSAAGLWSDRMRASYPPQTNIWGRFDRTQSIVTRSAAITSATSSTAAVAVDIVETMGDGSVRHWVGTWYLVRSATGWLLDQPGLRPA
jgi:hypothetical protein